MLRAVGHAGTTLLQTFKDNGLIVATSWERSSVFNNLNLIPINEVVTKSDSLVRHIAYANPKWEMWSSCTASNSGGEGTWLNT